MATQIKSPEKAYLENGTMRQNRIWLKQEIKHSDTFIDVGAHIGALFTPIVEITKPKRSIAFEPTPDSFEYLKENTKHLKNCEIYQKAAGNINGKLPFYEASIGSPSNTFKERFEDKRKPKWDVDVIKLDSLDIDGEFVMKLDAELSEREVWEGLGRNKEKLRSACIEIFNDAYKDIGIDVAPFLRQIRKDGFNIYNHSLEPLSDRFILFCPIIDIIVKR